jgi:uncharacterized membrane protein YjdF
MLMGLAAAYEILEWLVFEFSGPRLSFLFIGAQDDFYDTPKDMANTLAGILLASGIVFIMNSVHRKK